MICLIIGVFIWLICGILAHGAMFAYYKTENIKYVSIKETEVQYINNWLDCLLFSLSGGLLFLLLTLSEDGWKYGLKFW